MRATVVVTLVAMAGCAGGESTCEEKVALVDMESWAFVSEDDPFGTPTEPCTPDDVRMEPFNGGPVALDVDTRSGCGWATLVQPSAVELSRGDRVVSRLFYFSQTSFPAAVADVVLRVGDVDVWRFAVPIPTRSKLEPTDVEIEQDVPAGTPVYFHVGNHGDNSWSLLEVSRVRSGLFCSE